jgi:hypothetical protein
LLQGALGVPLAAASDAALDPVGVWACVVYGRPGLGDERLRFSLSQDGTTAQSRSERGDGPWVPLSDWKVRRGQVRFEDPRTGREYRADTGYATLGGTWQTLSLSGGWWCSKQDATLAGQSSARRTSASGAVAPPLVPTVTAIPYYPRQAIRDAKEGRAVVCFIVNNEGLVMEPEFIELSDEIFRQSTLDALGRSRYRAWEDLQAVRAGCRSFIFELDAAQR